ncbi:MAG: ribonuclease Y [Puniceicoccales bacterium]|jgi:ribonuclease Y|nr:ribonuclease Y [Puniceicoccales bacterium]
MFVSMRVRESCLIRTVREKCDQTVALGKKESELFVLESRAELDAASRKREEELREKACAVESLREKTARLHEEAAARAAEARRVENEALALRTRVETERRHYKDEALRVADISASEARKAVFDIVRQECETELVRLRSEILGRREEDIREEARRILVDTMQRLAPEVSQETNTAIISIPSEDMKGRLIGREGRNIKTFEQVTGTTLLVDETPDSVLVSSFDPVRREIARLALVALIGDGRIHPSSIESFVERAREQVIANVSELGRAALQDLNLEPASSAVTELLGRLHFRLSVNQNTLSHSIEVARFAGLIAMELGVDPRPARRAGLFHDIGKAIDAEFEGSHAIAGARWLCGNDEDPCVVNAVAAHHGEKQPTSIYAPIVMLADKISASRPGARNTTLDGYIGRMKSMERIAMEFPGVAEAYAVMAGREMRVIVVPEKLSEAEARETTLKIRTRIENSLQYTGTIHITLIREQRFHEEAR